MEQKHKDILNRNRVFLLSHLDLSVIFLQHLLADKVIQPHQDEQIHAETTSDSKVRLFILYLMRRGPAAFGNFIKALHATNQSFIAYELNLDVTARSEDREENWESEELHKSISMNELVINPTADVEVTMGSQSNSSEHSKPYNLEEDGVFNDTRKKYSILRNKFKDIIMSGVAHLHFDVSYKMGRPNEEDDCYPCAYSPRGVVYILNVRFADTESLRVGSDFDVSNIISLFGKMGYHVEVIQENKLQDIRKKMLELSKRDILSKVGVFMMFLMSHGKEKCLLDVDHNKMSIDKEFIRPFLSDKCPQLAHKPKLFFIQSCRGDQIHLDNDGGDDDDRINFDSSDPSQKTSIHPATDHFKFFSTPEENKSKRLSVSSKFIRILLLTISHFCHFPVIHVFKLLDTEFVKLLFPIQCPQLLHKPNLFFNQSSGGVNDHYQGDDGHDDSFEASDPSPKTSTHHAPDVFKFFSTFEDNKSIIFPKVNSPFIRCLLLTISHFCHQQPLDFMVKFVNRVMTSLNVEYTQKGCNLKQVSIAETTLTKDFFFNPCPKM